MDGIWSARGGKWKRFFDTRPQAKAFFTICGERYTVLLSGGSAAVKDGRTGERLARFKGFNYLYTGDIKPDETEFFALENGKHFYVFSLKNFTQRLRVTLPRRYEAIDVCGRYSEDGKILCVPAYKYDKGYTYVLFRYETDTYTLVSMEQMRDAEWSRNVCLFFHSFHFTWMPSARKNAAAWSALTVAPRSSCKSCDSVTPARSQSVKSTPLNSVPYSSARARRTFCNSSPLSAQLERDASARSHSKKRAARNFASLKFA